MKSTILALLLFLAPALFAVSAAGSAPIAQVESTACAASFEEAPEPVGKGDCSFQSDCGGAKCCNRRCAWASGSCCSFDSDCGFKGAKCRSGKCSNAPDGKCAFNSECPSGKCSSGKCK